MQPPAAEVAVWHQPQRRLWLLKNWMMAPQHTAPGGRGKRSRGVLRPVGRMRCRLAPASSCTPVFCACFELIGALLPVAHPAASGRHCRRWRMGLVKH
jgi:hypothetical protein